MKVGSNKFYINTKNPYHCGLILSETKLNSQRLDSFLLQTKRRLREADLSL